MSNRTMILAACLVLSGISLLAWQRSSSGQLVSAPAAAASNPRNMPIGGHVSVYLRGDATGTSASNRVIDMSSLVSIKGKLEAGGDHWIVLNTDDGKREWFPVDAVAAVVAE